MLKTVKRLLVLFLLFSCFWNVQAFDVPESKANFYVADYVGVISDEHAEQIRNINGQLEKLNGSQIVVAVFDFLNGEDIADVAVDCFNEWEIGDKKKNNGILLLLAIGEENYYCLQGKGLESSFPSSKIGDILYEYLEPDFAVENYSEGVMKTVQALSAELGLKSSSGIEPPIREENVENNQFMFVLIAIVLAVVATVILRRILLGPIARYHSYGRPHYYGRRDHYSSYSRPSSSYRPSRPSRSSSRNRGGGGSSRGGGAGRRK